MNRPIPVCMTIDVPILRIGDEDIFVYWLQSMLDTLGYGGIGVRCPFNGIMDSDTITALKKFQVDHRLKPTGIADENTWRAFNNIV